MFDNQYFIKYLADRKVDLSKHLEINKFCQLEIDPKEFEDFVKVHRENATVKSWHPRPFLSDMGNEQAINANWIGYNESNTKESNWGIDEIHNTILKGMVGNKNIKKLGIDPDKTLIRLLEYLPGHCDWGHVLQVHDNMISNWKPGDTYVIPPKIFHASANFGIAPKYTLTITGVKT